MRYLGLHACYEYLCLTTYLHNFLQVVLLVTNGQVTCNSMQTGKPIFDSHILDCIRAFPVITTEGYDMFDERKYFATIIKANDIYLHCRLFSASSDAQVSFTELRNASIGAST